MKVEQEKFHIAVSDCRKCYSTEYFKGDILNMNWYEMIHNGNCKNYICAMKQ